ncbi:putative serine--glyoxylate aminotransferase-like [Capsicum annuum]|nr:putative serine--glyoxylate aminotransferase-like [Capsicum annuum]
MELRSMFLSEFKIQQPKFTCVFSKQDKHEQPLVVVNIFSREAFPISYDRWKNIEVHCKNDQSIRHSPLSKQDNANLPELAFNRLQQTDDGYCGLQKRNFGRFIAREAVLDEEYWTAAWLRAEAHWESVSYMRHVDAYKRKYAEQEFYALKRRCSGQDGNCLKCFCFVAVRIVASRQFRCSSLVLRMHKLQLVKKEEKNVRRTVLNSVVGTLDLSIRQFVHRERNPGEIKRLSAVLARQEPFDSHKYAYIANVCVAKYARRLGIASNIIHLAADKATVEDRGSRVIVSIKRAEDTDVLGVIISIATSLLD